LTDGGPLASGRVGRTFAPLRPQQFVETPLAPRPLFGHANLQPDEQVAAPALEWPPMPGVLLVNYVDDFLLLSSSPALFDKAIGKLTDAVAMLPGGQFVLQLKAKGAAAKGFDFLGHRVQFKGGKLKTSPTEAAIADLWNQLGQIEQKLTTRVLGPGQWGQHDKGEAAKYIARMVAKIIGWRSAFSECDDPMQDIQFWVVEIVAWCKKLGVTIEEVFDAIEPYMGFRWGGYGFAPSVQNGLEWFSSATAAAA